jgi:plasmid maintenance system antidote protein VapI
MANKTKEKLSIEDQIKSFFNKTQSWLAKEIGMSETQLSRKLNKYVAWTQEDFDKINKILGTDFKIK